MPTARKVCTFLALLLLVSGEFRADTYQDRRLRTGARLFRSLLAADQDIEKKAAKDGHLLLLFFYIDNRDEAQDLAEQVFGGSDSKEPVKVRNLPVRVEFVDDPAFQRYRENPPAGIFLVHSPDDNDLSTIVQYGIDNHIVVFSPHEGHVEKGVLGGLVIEAQVLPFINMKTVRASGIPIKEFFLKVAKVVDS